MSTGEIARKFDNGRVELVPFSYVYESLLHATFGWSADSRPILKTLDVTQSVTDGDGRLVWRSPECVAISLKGDVPIELLAVKMESSEAGLLLCEANDFSHIVDGLRLTCHEHRPWHSLNI